MILTFTAVLKKLIPINNLLQFINADNNNVLKTRTTIAYKKQAQNLPIPILHYFMKQIKLVENLTATKKPSSSDKHLNERTDIC